MNSVLFGHYLGEAHRQEGTVVLDEVTGSAIDATRGFVGMNQVISDKMQVLLIEDNASDAFLINRILSHAEKARFSVDRAASLAEAISLLSQSDYDICLLDLGLPDGQGIDSLHRVRAVDARLPIVILTGNEDEQLGCLAIEAGAQDFVAKNCLSGQLLTRSLRFSMTRHMKMLGYASDANTDMLTGMPNRRELDQRFTELIATCDAVSFALLDIDHFKSINDRHGHLVGDEVLKHLASVIRKTLDVNVQAARFGGEEFALLIPEATVDQACAMVTHLLSEISMSPLEMEDTELLVTASAGVSDVARNDTLESILNRTDMALYEAKRAGRNRCCIKSAAGDVTNLSSR